MFIKNIFLFSLLLVSLSMTAQYNPNDNGERSDEEIIELLRKKKIKDPSNTAPVAPENSHKVENHTQSTQKQSSTSNHSTTAPSKATVPTSTKNSNTSPTKSTSVVSDSKSATNQSVKSNTPTKPKTEVTHSSVEKSKVTETKDTLKNNTLQQFNLDFTSDAVEADFYDSKSLAQVQKELKSGKKKYILYFGAPWCIPCRMMRETVFKAHDVKKYLNTYTITYVNIDDFNGMDIKDKYKVKNVPSMVVFDDHGKVIDRIDGSVSSTKFSEQLKDYQVRK